MIFINDPVLPSGYGPATWDCCEHGAEPSVFTTEEMLYIETYLLLSSFLRRYLYLQSFDEAGVGRYSDSYVMNDSGIGV
jgi:hypothetical protein